MKKIKFPKIMGNSSLMFAPYTTLIT